MFTVFVSKFAETRSLLVALCLDERCSLSSLLTEITVLHRPENVPSSPCTSECTDLRRNF